MMKPKSERLLTLETQAANALKADLLAVTDDSEALRDTIEGETDLHSLIALVMADNAEDEILFDGLTAMLDALAARRSRIELRMDRRRVIVQRAMEVGELPKLELPIATLSLRRVPPKVEVTDESLIPEPYWKPQPPKLDRGAVKDALRNGTDVPGATMSNGSITLTVRRT